MPYRPTWPEEFRRIAEMLRDYLGDTALRIDHIGSTAVPELAAKDVIDIQITVKNLEECHGLLAALERTGFEKRGGFRFDEIISNPELPKSQLRKWYFRSSSDKRAIHIHIRQLGNANQRYALVFRDYLRSHPNVRLAYQELKIRLANLVPNQKEHYLSIKDPLMDIIYCSAEQWASHSHWQADSNFM